MIDTKRVLSIVNSRGYAQPRDIMREMGADTFIMGAVLSQLKDSGQLRLSHVKVGGSPVYYLPANEPRLQELYKHLHDQEKKAYDLLKQNGVLRDTELTPVIRVALRNIKDYAKPVEVTIGEQKILFWRWFLMQNTSAESIIRDLLSKIKEVNSDIGPSVRDETVKSNVPVIEKQNQKTEEKIINPVEAKPITAAKKQIEEPIISTKKKDEIKLPDKNSETQSKIVHIESNVTIKDESSDFLGIIRKHFLKYNIEILETIIIKKNKEYDFLVTVPSAAGKINFYCKAKDKKRINEGDLSTAYVKGEGKKLPILYITTGDLTKKTAEMLIKEFKNISVNKI